MPPEELSRVAVRGTTGMALRDEGVSGRGDPPTRTETPPSPLQASGLALVVMVVLALAFLWIPHWILSVLPGSRSLRVGLATTWVGAAFFLASWLGWKASGPERTQDPADSGGRGVES